MKDDPKITDIEIEYARLKERYADLLIKADYQEQYLVAMVYGSAFSYEIDVTDDKIITFPDVLSKLYNTGPGYSYNNFIVDLCNKVISSTDKEFVLNAVSQKSMIDAYEQGKRQISIDYLSNGNTNTNVYEWHQNRVYLLQHPVSGHVNAIITIRNIQKEKTFELNLKERAQKDPLTSLANRSFMEEQIEIAIKENTEHHCAMLMDIDNFKQINDQNGHQAGDKALSKFAKMLLKKFRKDDIVARLGGDEFFVFMKNANPDIIKPRCESIIEACKTLMGPDSTIKVTPSIGVSIFPDHGETFKTLYEKADIALYESKLKGKNCYTIYDKSLSKPANK